MANKHILRYHANNLYLSTLTEQLPFKTTTTNVFKDPTDERQLNHFIKKINGNWLGFAEVKLYIHEEKLLSNLINLPIFVNKCDINKSENISYKNLNYISNYIRGTPNRQNKPLTGVIRYIYSPVIKWYLKHGVKIVAVYTAMGCQCNDSLKYIYDNITTTMRNNISVQERLREIFIDIDKTVLKSTYGDVLDSSRTCTLPIYCGNQVYIWTCLDIQGVAIAHLSGLRLMKFYYEFLSKYNQIDLIKVELNNIYISTTENMYEKMYEKTVQPDILTSFVYDKNKWLTCGDNITPGLFTVNLSADVTTDYELCNIRYNSEQKPNICWNYKEIDLIDEQHKDRYIYGIVLYNKFISVYNDKN